MNITVLQKKVLLFTKMTIEDIQSILELLHASTKTYKKNTLIYDYGDSITQLGIVLSGSIFINQMDYWGNRTILTTLHTYDTFGEAYAYLPNTSSKVSLYTNQDCEILFLDISLLLQYTQSSVLYKFQQNLLHSFAKKNYMLTNKMELLSKKTTKEKLMFYLTQQANTKQTNHFHIDFNRQQLADYLGVERSALSNELSSLQKQGYLTFHKNEFELIKF